MRFKIVIVLPLQGKISIGHPISTDMLPLQGISNEFKISIPNIPKSLSCPEKN